MATVVLPSCGKTREVGVTTLRTARVEDPAFYVFRSCDTQSRFAQLVAVSEQLFSEGDCCAAPGVFPSSQFVNSAYELVGLRSCYLRERDLVSVKGKLRT